MLDAIEKMSKTWFKKGEEHPNFGKKLPEETRNKISIAHKGKKLSEATKKKLSDINKGMKHGPPTKEKIERIIKSNPQKKPVEKVDPRTNEIVAEYRSAREASRFENIHASHIYLCCHNKVKFAKGFIWRFKTCV